MNFLGMVSASGFPSPQCKGPIPDVYPKHRGLYPAEITVWPNVATTDPETRSLIGDFKTVNRPVF